MMEEIFDIVDDNDNVIGQAARSAVHAQGWWHRGVHVLLFTTDGHMLIQKRSPDRKQYASLWDCSVSEHVKAGESYLEAAHRGLDEELGLQGMTLTPLFKFRMVYGPNDNEISTVYKGEVQPARVRFDPVEIAEVYTIPEQELLARIDRHPQEFCGWFIQIMRRYAGRPAEFQVMP